MAILYGTQSNGETLPVQVNEFGQLVAQGLDGPPGEQGPQGDQGPQGEPGEPGEPGADNQYTSEAFTPVLSCTKDGQVIQDIASANGEIWTVGGISIVQFLIRFNGTVITDARGQLIVGGFPALLTGGTALARRYTVFMTEVDAFKVSGQVTSVLLTTGDSCRFVVTDNGVLSPIETVNLNEGADVPCGIGGTIIGIKATPAEVLEQRAAAIAELRNS